jgi:hypothetical protein
MLPLLDTVDQPLAAVVIFILLVIIGVALAISFVFWFLFRHNLRKG